VCAQLSLREFGIELSKCFSNLRLDFLKCVYDGRSVLERYRNGVVNLHLHIAHGGMWCVTLEASNSVQVVSLKTGMNGEPGNSLSRDQVPVFVRVGAIAEECGPIASVVRLKPLDLCDMSGVDLYEHTWSVTPETIRAVFNRKLRSLLLDAGVKFGELEDEIIECPSKVIANLANKDWEPHSDIGFGGQTDLQNLVRGIRIEVNDTSVRLLPGDFLDVPVQFRKVFACPVYSCESRIKRFIGVVAHDSQPVLS